MRSKNFYISELDFAQSWKTGLNKINALNKTDKYMTYFWLLGPFIFLIERDPADLWLTIIGVTFIIRCFKINDWVWAKQAWFKFAICLWIYGLFISLLSDYIAFSFIEGFIWVRFPIYVVAIQAWLAKDRDIRVMMLSVLLIGLILMLVILFSEFVLIGQTGGRLQWPYGDTVPGSYLSKFSLPLFCSLTAIAVNSLKKFNLFSGIIVLTTIIICLLTGERMNFLILICSFIVAIFCWKPKLINFTILTSSIVVFFLTIVLIRPIDTGERFTKHFVHSILNLEKSYHWGAWRSGLHQISLDPFIGVGPSGTRKTCKDLPKNQPKWLPGKNYCGNHPHNFYIQLFAETGIVGFLIALCMIISIFKTCWRSRILKTSCIMSATAFIIPLSLFFPLQQFGSFYGQWGNLFTWFALGFAISQAQNYRNIKI